MHNAGRLAHGAGLAGDLIDAAQVARDMQQHGATGANVDRALHTGLATAQTAAELAGAAPAAAVLGAGKVGVEIGTRMVEVSDARAQRTGEYGADHHTGRRFDAPGQVVNRTGLDAAADDGIRTYQNAIRQGHGEAYSQAAGASVAMGHGLRNVARDNLNEGADRLLHGMGMDPVPPSQSREQQAAAQQAAYRQQFGQHGERDAMNVNPVAQQQQHDQNVQRAATHNEAPPSAQFVNLADADPVARANRPVEFHIDPEP